MDPIGVGLAVAFMGAMAWLFRWMFAVPPLVSREVAAARGSVTALRRILVPVVEAVASERAVELACRLGEAQKAEIIVLHVVEVPLTLPLGAPMEQEERRGQAALDTACAIVSRHGLRCIHMIIPDRHAADGILRVAGDQGADVIVLGLGEKRRIMPDQIGRTSREVLRRAHCEVVIDKAPILV